LPRVDRASDREYETEKRRVNTLPLSAAMAFVMMKLLGLFVSG
jgi:hypothetical protein